MACRFWEIAKNPRHWVAKVLPQISPEITIRIHPTLDAEADEHSVGQRFGSIERERDRLPTKTRLSRAPGSWLPLRRRVIGLAIHLVFVRGVAVIGGAHGRRGFPRVVAQILELTGYFLQRRFEVQLSACLDRRSRHALAVVWLKP